MKGSLQSTQADNMPIIRIAPVCNGKIYVIPHTSEKGILVMDLPIEDQVDRVSPKSDKTARKVKEKYQLHIKSDIQPRFSVHYKSAPHNGETIYLYILPLIHENDIQFHDGKFVSAEEIATNFKQYSPNLQKEGNLLGMAADLWKDYYQHTESGFK